jgi:hypothetical protein
VLSLSRTTATIRKKIISSYIAQIIYTVDENGGPLNNNILLGFLFLSSTEA